MNNPIEDIIKGIALQAGKRERYRWPVSTILTPQDARIAWHPDNFYVQMMAPDLYAAYDSLENIMVPQRRNAVRMTNRYRTPPWVTEHIHYLKETPIG